MGWKEEIFKSLKQTSVKGVTRLCNVRAVHLKLLWASAILLFLTTGFYQSYQLFSEYFSYPKLTMIRERDFSAKDDYIFPPIQVCNINHLGLLRDMPNNESIEYYEKLVTEMITCPNCSAEEEIILLRLEHELRSVYGYITYIGINKTLGLLTDYRDFLIECLVFTENNFVGTKCENFIKITKVLSFGHLLCLRIKFPKEILASKISMTFYIDSFENDMMEYNSENKWASKSLGIGYSILYSDAKNVPSVTQPSAPPGVMTKILISKELYKRLPAPHGNCVPSASDYTYDHCRTRCIRKSFQKYCNCVSPADYEPPDNKNLSFCISANLPQSEVLKSYGCSLKAYGKIVVECTSSCAQHCSETRYKTQVSYSKWPIPHQYASFYNKLIASKSYSKRFHLLSDSNTNVSDDVTKLLKRQLVEDNFVKIVFDLSNESYQEFVEVPKYSLFSFIGALGGALNLWTGITAIVAIEILETLMNLINKTTSRNQESKPQNE